MIIAIASGKGGTGKTTVAINLALALNYANSLFLDCDVEEPNAALFLHPTLEHREEVGILIPQVDEAKCTACGRCAEVCQFNAIAVIGQKVLVFPELCHGCGSCTLNCPEGAITEVLNVTGVLESGPSGAMSADRQAIQFWQGVMNVGEAMAVPIIHQLKERALDDFPPDGLAIIDVSPGASCPVVEAVQGADFALMVTEPTPFGLHDLRIAVEVIRDELHIPVGVVINREGIGDTGVDEYCAAEGVPILMRIPLDRRIAEAYSEGVPMIEALPEYQVKFTQLYLRIIDHVSKNIKGE